MKNRREGTPLLKESMSSNRLFQTSGLESKVKLSESRSFDQLRGLGRLEATEMKCMNNDGKKAKYRVVNNEEDQRFEDQSKLYFCSKCTIPLVQQGFIVVEIGKEVMKEYYHHPEAELYGQYKSQLEKMRK